MSSVTEAFWQQQSTASWNRSALASNSYLMLFISCDFLVLVSDALVAWIYSENDCFCWSWSALNLCDFDRVPFSIVLFLSFVTFFVLVSLQLNKFVSYCLLWLTGTFLTGRVTAVAISLRSLLGPLMTQYSYCRL